MGERYTAVDAQKALERLASTCGRAWFTPGKTAAARGIYRGHYYRPERVGDLRNPDGTFTQGGAWLLDHSPYGGYMVGETAHDGGGESTPFGHTRRPAREFCEAVNFAINAIEILTRD